MDETRNKVEQGLFLYLDSPRSLPALNRHLSQSVIYATCPMFIIFSTSSSLLTRGIFRGS